MSKCIIEGHYYKVDTGEDCITLEIYANGTDPPESDPQYLINAAANSGVTFYVKCQRCGDRRLINDKCYQDRKSGVYKL